MDSKIWGEFERIAQSCDEMGSPFTAKVCRAVIRVLDTGTATGRRLLSWEGDAAADAVPLRLCGGLHALALQGADELTAIYPPNSVEPDRLESILREAISRHDSFLSSFIERPPQTNEIARSALLLPGLLEIARQTGLPLALTEIGSSAGLNLFPDKFHYRYHDAEWGDPAYSATLVPQMRSGQPDLSGNLTINSRRGSDLSPLDIHRTNHRLRLRAYIWPDQPVRLTRLDAAIAVAQAGDFTLAKADAADFAIAQLAQSKFGECVVLMHSIVWANLPGATRQKIETALKTAGAAATPDAPLAWLRMEGAGENPAHATLQLTLWPGGETRILAQGGFHAQWIEWLG